MRTEKIHVGFDKYLDLNRVIAVASPNSAPIKRMVQQAKRETRCADLTSGRRTKAVVRLYPDDVGDEVALIAITPETFAGRVKAPSDDSAWQRLDERPSHQGRGQARG